MKLSECIRIYLIHINIKSDRNKKQKEKQIYLCMYIFILRGLG